MGKTSRCARPDGAAGERPAPPSETGLCLRLFHFVRAPSRRVPSRFLLLGSSLFLSRLCCDKVLPCLCPQPADLWAGGPTTRFKVSGDWTFLKLVWARSSGSPRFHALTPLDKGELYTCPQQGRLLFLCSFSRFGLMSPFRSELLDVRMPSTGKIGWRLWAPLALLALVPGVPSKAQDQGKCSPPPCCALFCFRPVSFSSRSPGDLLSLCPDPYPSSPSSPLLTSPPFSASAVSCFHIMSHAAHYTSTSPPFHPGLPPVYTQGGVMNARVTLVHQTAIVHKGLTGFALTLTQ